MSVHLLLLPPEYLPQSSYGLTHTVNKSIRSVKKALKAYDNKSSGVGGSKIGVTARFNICCVWILTNSSFARQMNSEQKPAEVWFYKAQVYACLEGRFPMFSGTYSLGNVQRNAATEYYIRSFKRWISQQLKEVQWSVCKSIIDQSVCQ